MWKFLALLLAAGSLLAPPSARAWGGAGHQLIAAETANDLETAFDLFTKIAQNLPKSVEK